MTSTLTPSLSKTVKDRAAFASYWTNKAPGVFSILAAHIYSPGKAEQHDNSKMVQIQSGHTGKMSGPILGAKHPMDWDRADVHG